jgi:hypothetical protein
VARRTLRIALLACSFALVLPALALAVARAVPASTAGWLLGAKMLRAEVALKSADGKLHDFRVDRGKLVKRYGGGQLLILERDGSKSAVKVASSARVVLNAKFANLRNLRPGMQVAVPRDGEIPADAVYAGSKVAPAIPKPTVQYLLGVRMLRAEIALQTPDTTIHDYLLDRGRIRQVSPYSLTLREADGSVVAFNVSATVRVKLNGKTASFVQLRRGMTATVMRDGEKPADQVWATGK